MILGSRFSTYLRAISSIRFSISSRVIDDRKLPSAHDARQVASFSNSVPQIARPVVSKTGVEPRIEVLLLIDCFICFLCTLN
jgi:hypothetical protein